MQPTVTFPGQQRASLDSLGWEQLYQELSALRNHCLSKGSQSAAERAHGKRAAELLAEIRSHRGLGFTPTPWDAAVQVPVVG